MYRFLTTLFLAGLLATGASADATTFAIAAFIKNETAWLQQWIHYYRTQGCSKVFLLDNGSTDHPEELLAPHIASGYVEIVKWPNKTYTGERPAWWWERDTQVPGYNEAIKRLSDYDWVGCLDLDEYAVAEHGTLLEALDNFATRYPEAEGMGMIWRCYGDSGVWELAPGELMIEKCTRWGDAWSCIGKVMLRPKEVLYCHISHCFVTRRGDQRCFDGSPYSYPRTGSRVGLQLNHYMSRTAKYLVEGRIASELAQGHEGSAERWRAFGASLNSHEDHDLWIQRFVPAVKASMAEEARGIPLLPPAQ